MAFSDNFKSLAPNTSLKKVNKTLLGTQGMLVMGIFTFFNTTYSVFDTHFSLWGKFIIFPAFMLTEVLMAGIATYWYLADRKKNLNKKDGAIKQRLDDIRITAIWIKTILIVLSGLAGLKLLPGAEAFSATLMIAGLSVYALASTAIDIYCIQQRVKQGSNYRTELYNKRYDLVSSLLLFTVVSCVTIANYIPELMLHIPGLSPLSVLVGALAGAATIRLAYDLPSDDEDDDKPLEPVKRGTNTHVKKTGDSQWGPEEIAKRRNLLLSMYEGMGGASATDHDTGLFKTKITHTQDQLAETDPAKRELLGLSPLVTATVKHGQALTG